MTRTRLRLALGAAALVACLAPLAASAEAQNKHTRLVILLQLATGTRHNFQNELLQNCNLFFVNGRSVDGRVQVAGADGVPTGTLDFGQSRGEAFVRKNEWSVEPLPPIRGKPTAFADIGVELAGNAVYLTARITKGRSNLAAARRQRLAIVRGAKRADTRILDQSGKPLPNTFSYITKGKLKMLPAMSRAIDRTRCKNRRQNRFTHRLKPGYELGTLRIGLRPDHATGLGGDVLFKPVLSARGEDDDLPVAVEPTGGVTQDRDKNFVAPIAAGLPVPLTCEQGLDCEPTTPVTLGGGFDLAVNGRRASVANLTYVPSTDPNADARTISGTLNGTPLTIASGGNASAGVPTTPEFTRRTNDVFGLEVSGEVAMLPRFTRTGP